MLCGVMARACMLSPCPSFVGPRMGQVYGEGMCATSILCCARTRAQPEAHACHGVSSSCPTWAGPHVHCLPAACVLLWRACCGACACARAQAGQQQVGRAPTTCSPAPGRARRQGSSRWQDADILEGMAPLPSSVASGRRLSDFSR